MTETGPIPHSWLRAEGCELQILSTAGPLFRQEIHRLDAREVARWIRPPMRVVDDDGGYNYVIPERAFRLVVEEIPHPLGLA